MIITKCQTVSWLELIEELPGVRGKSYDLVLGNAYNLRMFDMIACHISDKYDKESILFYKSYKSYFNLLECNKNK